MNRLALVVLGGLGCAGGRALGVAECPGPAPVDAGPYPRYDADSAALVAGIYEFVELNLSDGQAVPPQRARLVLTASYDTATRTVLRGTAMWLNAAGNAQSTERATVDLSGRLDLGDGMTDYRIVALNGTSLWGLWERRIDEQQLQLVDSATGRVVPNPAGVFCAVRTVPDR